MMVFDETRWPLVEMTGSEQRSAPDIVTFTETLDRILARQEPFALIMLTVRDDQPVNPLAANQMMKWLKGAKPAITAYCRGIATVLESAEERAKYGPMMISRGEEIYGCPVSLVANVEEASRWATGRLATTGQS
jgi:hypothetical protein